MKDTTNSEPIRKHLLYLRGQPGVGKITVAKLLEEDLGWRLFWFHDLKNAVYNIVQEHRIPRLMDACTILVMRYLMERGDNIIFVRPSPDKETVEAVQSLVSSYPNYEFHPVLLTAPYDTLLRRVSDRDDPYRINTKDDLDRYLTRATVPIPGEQVVDTQDLSAKIVAAKILADMHGSGL